MEAGFDYPRSDVIKPYWRREGVTGALILTRDRELKSSQDSYCGRTDVGPYQ